MSNLSDLYPSGGGGTPINGLAQFANAPVLYDALDGGTYLQAGNISTDIATYPDALFINSLAYVLFLQDFSVASQDTSPSGIFFRADGLKMYMVGFTYDKVYEYDLSTAWNISTAVYLQDFSVVSQDGAPLGIFFKSDGLKMYMVGNTGDKVYEYDLSTAWNISTAVYLQDFSVASQEIVPQGIFFKADGLKMYMVGSTNDKVYEYDLSTAWNITTAVYLQDFSVASQDSNPSGIFFKADGLKMYMVGSLGDKVYEYDIPLILGLSSATGLDANTYVRIK